MISVVKYDYFEKLEQISDVALSAVRHVCSDDREKNMGELRKNCDGLVYETENALFQDFMPPLERDNIAAAAHAISRVVDKAYELSSITVCSNATPKVNEEAKICVSLAEKLKEEITALRRIKRPNELPDITGFRELLREGREAHKTVLSKIRSGALPKSYADYVIHTGRLRSEISAAYDEIVEIMLNNI